MKKTGLCPYCAEIKELTDDHIPPEAIFIKPRPNNLVTIYACFECNNGASNDDEGFRNMLSILLGNTDEETSSLFNNTLRSIKRNKRISRNIQRNILSDKAYLVSPAGLIIEEVILIKNHPEFASPFKNVIERITKGLYFNHYNRVLSKNTIFSVRLHNKCTSEMLDIVSMCEIKKIGTGHFSYAFTKSMEDFKSSKEISLWIFEFYKKYWVSCVTKNSE